MEKTISGKFLLCTGTQQEILDFVSDNDESITVLSLVPMINAGDKMYAVVKFI